MPVLRLRRQSGRFGFRSIAGPSESKPKLERDRTFPAHKNRDGNHIARMMPLSKLAAAALLLAPPCSARPTHLSEGSRNPVVNFAVGVSVGFDTLLSLTGYWQEDDVRRNLASAESESFEVGAEDEEDQTRIKLVGLGLGRTGSTSLAIALERLGYVVVHDDEVPEETDLFEAYYEEEDIDEDEFHELLGLRGYNATMTTAEEDWVRDHPEVKGILTVRDSAEKYADSWAHASYFIDIIDSAPFRWMPTVGALREKFLEEYMPEEDDEGGRTWDHNDREGMIYSYNKYNARVVDTVPAERLLVYNVKEGWGPLCEFLEVDECPGGPFPHVHTRAKLMGEHYFLLLVTWIWPLAVVVPGLLLCKAVRAVIGLVTKTKERKGKLC